MNTIPFFYYDIVARMFPGGMIIAVLALARSDIRGIGSGTEGWKAAVVPLVLAATAYMLGILCEAVTPDWWFWKWLGDRTFTSAAKAYPWTGRTEKPALDDLSVSREFRDKIWFDLILAGKKDEAQAFPHALRMWAEAKMCLHSFMPALAASIILACKQRWFWAVSAIAVAAVLLFGVYSRDKRRWIQILYSNDHMN